MTKIYNAALGFSVEKRVKAIMNPCPECGSEMIDTTASQFSYDSDLHDGSDPVFICVWNCRR